MPDEVLAFDVFGTLADPASYAEGLRPAVPDPESLATSWRRQQLEISWLVSLTGAHRDWPTVTAQALDMAAWQSGVRLTDEQRSAALQRVAVPELFDDARPALEELSRAGRRMVLFSNGGSSGLERIVREHGIAEHFADIVSCSDLGVYKPSPRTYRTLTERVGAEPGRVWLVSGNPFDCSGAALAGLRVAEVERQPEMTYPFAPDPDVVIGGLSELNAALPAQE